MNRERTFRKYALSGWGLSLTLAGVLLVPGLVPGSRMQVISSAEAIVGRPFTPVSYAGVARRTTRRAVYYGGAATAAYVGTAVAVDAAAAAAAAPIVYSSASPSIVASPPQGCTPQGAVFVCGGYAYQPMMQGSTVVYAVHPAQ